MSAEARMENEASLRIIVHQLGMCHHGRAQRRLMLAGRSFTRRFPFSFGAQKNKDRTIDVQPLSFDRILETD